jgi:hypothetical protein
VAACERGLLDLPPSLTLKRPLTTLYVALCYQAASTSLACGMVCVKEQRARELNLPRISRFVNDLRKEVVELQERWEELGEELEGRRGRLRLAEATWEMLSELAEKSRRKGAARPSGQRRHRS